MLWRRRNAHGIGRQPTSSPIIWRRSLEGYNPRCGRRCPCRASPFPHEIQSGRRRRRLQLRFDFSRTLPLIGPAVPAAGWAGTAKSCVGLPHPAVRRRQRRLRHQLVLRRLSFTAPPRALSKAVRSPTNGKHDERFGAGAIEMRARDMSLRVARERLKL